ncbi:PepSY-associated TM helix domain-containing protein [Hyphococcus sp.]|uniref:PepSY-associated TM helix domain-containing protein n=1 Tax=Hyphococcus sp. TaxID=2038636 RepID=UPI003D0C7AD8
MSENQAIKQKKPARRSGGYLFIPKKLQRPDILLWLRRSHAWTGFYGALFFFVLGLTGFYLNHRTAIMHIEGGTVKEVASLSAPVEPGLITSEEALAAWMQEAFAIDAEPSRGRGRRGGPVSFGGRRAEQAPVFTVSFRGPNAVITGEYELGANRVTVKRTNSSLLKALVDLHKVVGVNKLFILIMDTMAGAMMFMVLSGVLLWTRLHGPRLAAAGILGAVAVATAFALSGTLIGWAAP